MTASPAAVHAWAGSDHERAVRCGHYQRHRVRMMIRMRTSWCQGRGGQEQGGAGVCMQGCCRPPPTQPFRPQAGRPPEVGCVHDTGLLASPTAAGRSHPPLSSTAPATHRQAVPKVDFVHDAHVVRVAGVVRGRGHPLVAHKRGAGLEHAEDLAVHRLQLRAGGGRCSPSQPLGCAGCGLGADAACIRRQRHLLPLCCCHCLSQAPLPNHPTGCPPWARGRWPRWRTRRRTCWPRRAWP